MMLPLRAAARTRARLLVNLLLVLLLMSGLVATVPGIAAAQTPAASPEPGVNTITGSVKVTNPFISEDYTEPYVALMDLTAFVKRDYNMPLPEQTQVTTGFVGDWANGATFTLPLPIIPRGQFNNVAHGQGGKGVQLYSVDAQANLVGDPYIGKYEGQGWSTSLTSMTTTVDTGEVTGGKIVVWSPDDNEYFPSDFGADGKLFTADDPVGPIPAGWTVVDLDHHPFSLLRAGTVNVPIIEGDAGLKDLSHLTYTQAFDALVKELRVRYPYTQLKGIDWDKLIAQVRPMVVDAEQKHDLLAFNLAMMHFAILMHDGHVGVQIPGVYFGQLLGGGLGVGLGLSDDQQLVVRCVTSGKPAANAGIKPGAVISDWNGQKPTDALAKVTQIQAESNQLGVTRQRLALLGRMPVGTDISITYQNPGASQLATANLEAVPDSEGLTSTCDQQQDDPAALPLTTKILPSGFGYIRINTFDTDLLMLDHEWEWALNQMNDLKVPGLIIDIRGNSGGSSFPPIYFAGSFYNDSFVLDQTIVTTTDGKRQEVGEDLVQPAPVRWTKPVAVLIDDSCASACEIFAAAMAHNPANLIVGMTPTAGIEAGVEPWTLPGGLYFQAPVIGLYHPDGKVFLEGTGVTPNVKVPQTPENLVIAAGHDPVLDAAVSALKRK